jgi:ubiquinone/menaquinone biosynthesis C-methylase UbiE
MCLRQRGAFLAVSAVEEYVLDLPANIDRFCGFADRYDRYRPQPPSIIQDILTRLAGVQPPRLVVDLGSGTGLSTRVWAERATQVIGVEPNPEMRDQAQARTAALSCAGNVRYTAGDSTRTGLPDGCADIVTCSQSLHWMEPISTFAEAARVLRFGGVFAAYDCDWPPTVHWEAELAYNKTIECAQRVGDERGLFAGVRRWGKAKHLTRLGDSGRFRFVKEIVVHHVEEGNAERFVGLALSQGRIATLLKSGVGEDEFGLDELRAVAQRTLGDSAQPWYWSYRIRLGIK